MIYSINYLSVLYRILFFKFREVYLSDFCEIKEVTKIEGEASANNRKAKLFFFYEWEITAKWTGIVTLQVVLHPLDDCSP